MDLLHKKSVLVLMLCVLYSFFISACSGGGGTAKSNVSFSNVSIDQMTLVPSINGTSTSGLMYVHNSGSNSVKILNLGLANLVSHAVNLNQSTPRINANAIGVISDDHGLTLETSDCTTIPAHGYCTFRFHTPSNLSLGGSGITKVTLNYLNAGIAGSTSGIIHYQYMSTSKKFGVNFTGNLQVTAGAEPQYVIGYLWSSSSVANQVFRKVKLTLSDPSLSINNGFTQLQDIAVGEVIPVEFKVNAATSITGNISVKSTPPSNSSTVQVQPSWNNPNYPVSGDAMAITATSSTSIQLYNYLGTGSDPNLLITLENSGVSGWTNGYSISYGSSGGIPYNGSSTSSANWSVWNVYDSSANYYGTITLTTNGSTISYSSYSSTGTNGNYLDGIYIVNGNNLKAESVVCASCHSSSGVANLINSIGNGSNPNITLTLSTNAAGWEPYALNWGQSGGIPGSGSNGDWSSWNATDANGNYYGTVTLTFDGSTILFDNYSNTPGNSESLSNIVVSSMDTTVSPSTATITAIATCGICDGPFPDAPPATPPTNFNLTTSSNQLLLNGEPIRLKGVARPSLEWDNKGQYLSVTDIQNMKSFGSNVIRLDMNADYWNSSAPPDVMGSYQQIIDAIIYYAEQNNMLVILDYHWFNSTVEQQSMAPRDVTNGSLQFLNSMATKYANWGNVLIELYNEPYGITYNTWLNGDNNLWYGMQDLYNTIRGAGANNIVIAGGLDYAYYLGFIALGVNNCGTSYDTESTTDCFIKDPSTSNGYAANILYNSHPYSIGGGEYKGESTYTYLGEPADFVSNFAGIKNNYPIIFTEFGDNQEGDYNDNTYQSVYTAIINEIESNGINYSGFAWWIQDGSPWFPVLICGDWSSPTICFGGLQVHNNIVANPGTTFTTLN